MDFSQVDDATLRRYRRVLRLRTHRSTMHRDELVAAVTKHFNEQQLNEKDAVSHFIYALRNQGVLWKANLANRIGADNAGDEEENRD